MACTLAEKELAFCRRLETGSRQWIGQRTLVKLVGQGDWQDKLKVDNMIAVPIIRQGNTELNCVSLNARSIINKKI